MASEAHGTAAVVHAQERDFGGVVHSMTTGAFHFSLEQFDVRPPLYRIGRGLVIRIRNGIGHGNRVIVAQIRPRHRRQRFRVDAAKCARMALDARRTVDVAAAARHPAGLWLVDNVVLVAAVNRASACTVVATQA